MRLFIIEANKNRLSLYEHLFKKECPLYTTTKLEKSDWYLLDDFLPTVLVIDEKLEGHSLNEFFEILNEKNYAKELKIFLTCEPKECINSFGNLQLRLVQKPIDALNFKEMILKEN